MQYTPSTDTIDLDAYFQRIGYSGERTATLPVLEAIHYGHARAIAFENLTPLLGQPVLLDLGALQQKLVNSRRDGYCFEQNGLFCEVLTALGFQVTCLAARVLWSMPEDLICPRIHMVLLVHVDDIPYVADVGFGGLTLTTPLRLTPDIQQPTSHEPFRILEVDDTYLLQVHFGQEWQSLYQFDLQPQHPPDYEVSNWYVATHPKSLFVNSLMAARPDTDCRYALRDNHFAIHHRNGKTEKHTLTTVKEFCAVLSNEFQLTLPDHQDLENTLQRLIRSDTADDS